MNHNRPLKLSSATHFNRSDARHGLRRRVLGFILTHAAEVQAEGARYLVVLDRDLPPALLGSELAARARDWIVVVDDHGRPRACCRRRDAARVLRHLPKYQRTRVRSAA